MSYLRIASFNVRGLGNANKRRKIFNYLHHKEFDIVLLQETHSVRNQEKFWRSIWGSKIYYSHGTNDSRGVCILLAKKSLVKVFHSYKDAEGRIIAIDIFFENQSICLVNIYAPNLDDPAFFDEIFTVIEASTCDMKIFGGDFNVILDPNKDKKGDLSLSKPKMRNKLLNIMKSEQLVDVWRTQHLEDHLFTWTRAIPS